ncbi:MAG: protein kinase domain-containing protein [Thermoguttaceae bacterium]
MSEVKCCRCGLVVESDQPCPHCLLEMALAGTGADTGGAIETDAVNIAAIREAFPHLEILEQIGRGGMGTVFKARQPRLDRFVALKILSSQLAARETFADRFAQEGKLLAKLNHPNIVSVYDYGEANGLFYLLLEYVDGVNLRQAMREERFTPEQAIGIVPKICDALQYAHDEGVLHRDIKPENILLDVKGRVKIADFGIAGVARPHKTSVERTGIDERSEHLTPTGTVLGTPHYMAPEQWETPDHVDHRADIYSLGVVFYELLTGELPRGVFPPPSTTTPVASAIDGIVMKALQKNREERQQTAVEMKTEIETAAVTATPQSTSIWKRIVNEVKTWPIWATILVVCVAGPVALYVPVVVILSIFFLISQFTGLRENLSIYAPLLIPLGFILFVAIVYQVLARKRKRLDQNQQSATDSKPTNDNHETAAGLDTPPESHCKESSDNVGATGVTGLINALLILCLLFNVEWLTCALGLPRRFMFSLFDPVGLFLLFAMLTAFIVACGYTKLIYQGFVPNRRQRTSEEVRQIGECFWTLAKITPLIGIALTSLGYCNMLANLDSSRFFEGVQVIFLTTLYGVFVSLILFVPTAVAAFRQHGVETDSPQPLRFVSRQHCYRHLVLGWLIAAGFLLASAVLSGNPIAMFCDLPSAIIVAGCLALYVSFRQCWGLLFRGLRFQDETREQASQLFSQLTRISLGAGFLGTLIGVYQMVAVGLDPEIIGTGVAVSLLTLLYGILLAVFVWTPLSVLSTRRRTITKTSTTHNESAHQEPPQSQKAPIMTLPPANNNTPQPRSRLVWWGLVLLIVAALFPWVPVTNLMYSRNLVIRNADIARNEAQQQLSQRWRDQIILHREHIATKYETLQHLEGHERRTAVQSLQNEDKEWYQTQTVIEKEAINRIDDEWRKVVLNNGVYDRTVATIWGVSGIMAIVGTIFGWIHLGYIRRTKDKPCFWLGLCVALTVIVPALAIGILLLFRGPYEPPFRGVMTTIGNLLAVLVPLYLIRWTYLWAKNGVATSTTHNEIAHQEPPQQQKEYTMTLSPANNNMPQPRSRLVWWGLVLLVVIALGVYVNTNTSGAAAIANALNSPSKVSVRFLPLGLIEMIILVGIVIAITLIVRRALSPNTATSYLPTKFCTHCGAGQIEGAYACKSCGFANRVKRAYCFHCGAKTDPEQILCVACGTSLGSPLWTTVHVVGAGKSRVIAAILALLTGWLGIHKFYLGSWGWGIVYFLFSATLIPFIASIVEGIGFLAMDDSAFDRRYNQTQPRAFRW